LPLDFPPPNKLETGPELAPIPMILAAGAVHTYLVRQQLRTFTPAKAVKTSWGQGRILVSFLCDAYQPLEEKLQVTRQALELVLLAGHHVRIQTRATLVRRDFDLLVKYKDQVRLGTSLPHLDDDLAKVLEPKAPGPTARLEMLPEATDLGFPFTLRSRRSCHFTNSACSMTSWPGSNRCTPPRSSAKCQTPRETVSQGSSRRWRLNIPPSQRSWAATATRPGRVGLTTYCGMMSSTTLALASWPGRIPAGHGSIICPRGRWGS